ncbi:MAG: hypothetical protein FJZ01_09395, partial [Candidatus Sericytochromatia bacterium]|nr:hypothetical protein [Candidatus Tanganyikabacteria bacterium]
MPSITRYLASHALAPWVFALVAAAPLGTGAAWAQEPAAAAPAAEQQPAAA